MGRGLNRDQGACRFVCMGRGLNQDQDACRFVCIGRSLNRDQGECRFVCMGRLVQTDTNLQARFYTDAGTGQDRCSVRPST